MTMSGRLALLLLALTVRSTQQPDLATGDLATRKLPDALGALVTGTFTVSR